LEPSFFETVLRKNGSRWLILLSRRVPEVSFTQHVEADVRKRD
jgi:hypothetical protein